MNATSLTIIEDPSENAPRHHVLALLIEYPTYGKPSDDTKTAQAVKAMLQTGLHSRIKVSLFDGEGTASEVGDRTYRNI